MASLTGFRHQFLGVDRMQGRQTHRHGEWILAERRGVHDRSLDRVEDLIEDGRPPHHGPDRNHASRQRLGETHQIRLHPVVIDREHVTGPSQTGLHLVRHEQRTGPTTDLRDGGQRSRRMRMDTLPLDRLQEHRGDPTIGQRPFERLEITERHLPTFRNERLESSSQPLGTVQRQRTEGQTVERVRPVGESRSPRGGAGHLHGRLHRLGPAVDEEHPIVASSERNLQSVRERDCERRNLELDQGRGLKLQRLPNRVGQNRMIPPQRETGESSDRVEVSLPRLVEEMGPLRPHESPIEPQKSQEIREARIQMERIVVAERRVRLEDVLEIEGRQERSKLSVTAPSTSEPP